MIPTLAGRFGPAAGDAAVEAPPEPWQEASAALAEGPVRVAYTPAACAGTHDGVTAVVAGTLLDTAALAKALGVAAAAGAPSLVAAAYSEWGNSFLSRLRGAFALAVWSSRTLRGVLAVDQLGAGALFYRRESGGLVFASELAPLLERLRTGPEPAVGALSRFVIDGALAEGETLLEGITRLRGGRFLQLGREPHERTFWEPRYGGTRAVGHGEAVEDARHGIFRAIRRRLPPSGSGGILLSGGVDSGSVAAAARHLDPSLVAYSAVFPEHPPADESAQIARVAQALRLPSSRIAFRGGGSVAAALEFLGEWRIPSISPNLAFQLALGRLARDDGRAALLDGQGGDELFGAPAYLLADRIRHGRVLDAWRLAKAVPEWEARDAFREYGLKGALPSAAHAIRRRLASHAEVTDWLTPAARAAYGSGHEWGWKSLAGPRWWAYQADLLTRQRERMGAHDLLRHRFAMAGTHGLHPFLDDVDLVETVLALPPVHSFGRLDRPLLRGALRDLAPEAVLRRDEKSFFDPLFVDSLEEDRAVIERLLGGDAQIYAYVQRETVRRRLLEAPERARRGAWAWLLWRVLAVECFLRTQADADFPHAALGRWRLSRARFSVERSD